MKKDDVMVGATYVAKLGGKLTRVRIERESPYGGWAAVNAETGRRVRIKTAQRLRFEAVGPKRAKAIAAADQENARLRDERELVRGRQNASRYADLNTSTALSFAARSAGAKLADAATSNRIAQTPK